jgi:hypothetical protein
LSTSSMPWVTSTRVVVDDGRIRKVIRADMRGPASRARERTVHRRGRSLGHAHRAIGGPLLGTLVRHALASPASVLALPIVVIEPALFAGLVPGMGASMRRAVARGAALGAAIELAPVMAATEVENPAAPRTTLRSKALRQGPPSPERGTASNLALLRQRSETSTSVDVRFRRGGSVYQTGPSAF